MDIRLEPKQGLAFLTDATEVLYGGAAGGGKSFLLRTSMIRWCVEVAGIQCYLFRRTLPDLRDNHLRGPTSFFALLADALERGEVKYRAVENEFEWVHGSILHLCYCDSENDVEKYRGAEIHVLGMDELTHFSEYQYRFLRSRVRVAGLKIPEKYRAKLPRIENASNPGSIGHAWVKRTFIQPEAPMKAWRAGPSEGGMVRQFIPARLADNPHLTKDDPEYANRLRGLGADTLVRAMLEGDWDIIAGAAFEKLRKETHCIPPIEVPEDWLIFGSLDWGSTRPFSYGLWAISNGNALKDGRLYPKGAMIRFTEFYGWNGKPNEGLRMEAGEVADGILKLESGKKPAYRVADPSMWKVDGGPSIAERMLKHGCVLRRGDNSRNVGYVEVRARIAGDADGPMLYATENCHHGFWRTMPDLVMDEHKYGPKSEDVDTDQEDHCFVADTLVCCYNGMKRLGDLVGSEGLVWSEGSWRSYRSCRLTRRNAKTVSLEFSNGDRVRCTPGHRFMLESGQWCEARNLQGKKIRLSLAIRSRSSAAFVTISADCTSVEKENSFTARFGNGRMGRLPWVVTSITSILTAATTSCRILASCLHRGISRFTWRLQNDKPTPCAQSKSQENTPALGMEAPKGLLGTGNIIWSTARKRCEHARKSLVVIAENFSSATSRLFCVLTPVVQLPAGNQAWTMKQGIARFVGGNSGPTNTAKSEHAAVDVEQNPAPNPDVMCLKVQENNVANVYCLTVPETGSFTICSGLVVSNCYDDVRYACMSRPWMRHVEKDKPKVDRWMRFEEKDESTWRTA